MKLKRILAAAMLVAAPMLVGFKQGAAPASLRTDIVWIPVYHTIEATTPPAIDVDGVSADFRDGVVTLDFDDRGLKVPAFSLKIRAENTLRHYLPEVARVEFVDQRQAAEQQAARGTLDLDDPETASVQSLLDERINPTIAAHGGWITLLEVRDHTAYVRLEGGCQGCGMADVTLKQGVESLIRDEVPSIVAVLDSTDHASGDNPYFEPGKSGYAPYY